MHTVTECIYSKPIQGLGQILIYHSEDFPCFPSSPRLEQKSAWWGTAVYIQPVLGIIL